MANLELLLHVSVVEATSAALAASYSFGYFGPSSYFLFFTTIFKRGATVCTLSYK
jgi:hypothetical protein